jgi:serine/threonine-protein phosphatase 2A regulatory subunit A
MSADEITPKSIIDGLVSREPKQQIISIRNISKLFPSIPPDKFRNEFIPFLITCIPEEEDDVLEELFKVYREIFNYMEGKKYIKDTFPLVELIFHTGNMEIRKELIIYLRHIIDKHDEFGNVEKDLFELMKKLANTEDVSNENGFVALSAEFFGDFKEKYRNQIYNLYLQFAQKKNQGKAIKIQLSANLMKISKFLQKKEYTEMFDFLMEEKCDAVRFNLVEAIGYLKEKEKSKLEAYQDFIGEKINKFCEDESWRVRLMLAKYIVDIFELVKKISEGNNNSEIKKTVLKAYLKLLQDKEGEVRSLACEKLEEAAEFLIDMEDFDKILSCLKNLKSDPLPYVRSSLASNILSMAPIVNTNKTNEYIFPIFLDLIKDEAHDIRMLIIKNLDKLNEVVNIDNYVQGIIPSLVEISDNNNWHVRNQVQEIIPTIARIVKKKIFLDSIMPICLKWLTDQVYAIRQNACKILKRVYNIFKGEDFEKKLIAKLNAMSKHENYLIRITVVLLIKEFLNDEYELDFMEKKLFPILVKLSDDKISNIRQACTHLVKKLGRLSKNKDVIKECKSIIDELKIDKDIEVVYAAIDN